ncbi:MAG: helix-turn-helix domain-containing protein [Sedimentibacter sp.]
MLEKMIKEIVEETVKVTLSQLSNDTSEVTKSSKLNTKQVAEFIGMSIPWVYQNLHILPHKKMGRKLIFDTSEITEFLKERDEDNRSIKQQVKTKASKINEKYKVV